MCRGPPPVKSANHLPDDSHLLSIDLDELKKDMDELKTELSEAQGEEDVKHFQRMRFATECFAVLGTVAMLLPAEWLVAPILLAVATTQRWCIIGHHTCHGGYDWTEDQKFHRMRFALGPWRRCVDWFDWMLPEAWNIEHNHRHHYNLGEDSDPDQLEMNMYDLRPGGPLGGLPNVVKRVLVAIIATLWKWWYYAPNTYKHLIRARAKKAKDDVNFDRANTNLVWTLFAYMLPGHWHFLAQLFGEVLLPFAVYKFGVYPLPFLLLGKAAYLNALRCVLCAEMLSNVYAFVIIGPNHSGDDMYCYDTHVEPYSGGFYLRAILSSANFDAGTDTIDFLHGFLNYQVEHHCFPSLTALSYRKAMPRVKAICAKHGIPYTQQNVFKRVLKTVEIMIGSQSLRRFPKAAVKAE